MTFFNDSATDWADDHSLSAETRFSRLETVAFQRHSEFFHTLALRVGTAEMRARTVVVRRVVAQPCRVVLGS